MRKTLLLLILMAITLTACSRVDPGYVGVKVNKLGGDKGVESEPLSTGMYWTGFNWTIYQYPIFQQNELWSLSANEGKQAIDQSISFQSNEGLTLNADVGCVYTLDQTAIPKLFQRFRLGIDEISDGYLRQLVRDAMNVRASSKNIDILYGEGRNEFLTLVLADVRKEVAPLGIQIHNITIGELRLPQAILLAMNAKIAATQKAIQAENELRQTQAEAKKVVAQAEGAAQAQEIRARAEAQANQKIAASITPTLVEYKRIEKWDGKLPQVSGNSMPLVNMNPDSAAKK